MTITPNSLNLTWSPPVGGGSIDAYVVLSRVTGSGPFAVLAETTGVTYAVTGLIPGATYDFGVYAKNSAGPGDMMVATATTLNRVPNAATSLAAAAGLPGYNAAVVTWSAAPTDSDHGPATGYHIYYRIHTGTDSSWTYSQDVVGLAAALTGLAHHTSYDFLVVPFNALGSSLMNNTVSAYVTDYAPPNAPTAPAAGPVSDGTTSELTVTWSSPTTDGTHDAATSYDLRYSVSGVGAWTTITGDNSGTTITGLASGTSYDVQVRAKNASTTSPSAWSSSTTASTYSVAVAWGLSGSPQAGYVHGTGNMNGVKSAGINMHCSPNPTIVYLAATTSGTIAPTTGLTAVSYYGTTYEWACFYPVPNTPGTFYLWALAEDGSGNVLGALVSSAITVT